ncbi:MAG: DUF2778 domain-containing protein [Nitrospiraceae bacterium]|nr:DUF2778 domain-containing protein [Nitrospiraceae bacterium]
MGGKKGSHAFHFFETASQNCFTKLFSWTLSSPADYDVNSMDYSIYLNYIKNRKRGYGGAEVGADSSKSIWETRLNRPINFLPNPFSEWLYYQSTGELYYREGFTWSESQPTLAVRHGDAFGIGVLENIGKTKFYIGRGYSGRGEGLNNPDMQDKIGEGPIPRGTWDIGEPGNHRTHDGKELVYSMRLTPLSVEVTDRSGFFIHGDNRHMNHTASDGCIVLDLHIREQIGHSKVKRLRVLP